jgi:hypothetical protein
MRSCSWCIRVVSRDGCLKTSGQMSVRRDGGC